MSTLLSGTLDLGSGHKTACSCAPQSLHCFSDNCSLSSASKASFTWHSNYRPPFGVGVGTSLIWAVDHADSPFRRESGYARLSSARSMAILLLFRSCHFPHIGSAYKGFRTKLSCKRFTIHCTTILWHFCMTITTVMWPMDVQFSRCACRCYSQSVDSL